MDASVPRDIPRRAAPAPREHPTRRRAEPPGAVSSLHGPPTGLAGLRSPSGGRTVQQAVTGPGSGSDGPSSTGYSPGDQRRPPSQPPGTLCLRWTVGGLCGGDKYGRPSCKCKPKVFPCVGHHHVQVQGLGVMWGGTHDLLDVEVGTPVLLNARHMPHANDAHNHRRDTLPGLSCQGRANISGRHRNQYLWEFPP